MNIIHNFQIIGDILAIVFAIADFLRSYLNNLPIIKYIYPENWHKYIKVYFFTNINAIDSDLDCEDVSIRAEKIDPNSEFTVEIPFKLCIPSKSVHKLGKIDNLIITFQTGQESELHIIRYKHDDLGKTIKLDQKSLQSGFEGRYYIKVTRAYGGVSVTINVDATIHKRNEKRSWIMRSNIIINGLETDSIKLRT